MKPIQAFTDPGGRIIPSILSFSAADPTCGSGLHADILTIAALGGMPLGVTTSVVIQSTALFEGLLSIDDDWIADQARAVLEDIPVHAFKVGTLGSVESIVAVAEVLSDYPDIPVVYDPALMLGSNDPLADEDFLATLGELLLPQTAIITPSLAEARSLVQEEDEDDAPLSAADCARRLQELGCGHVLISGRHDQAAQIVNTLYGPGGIIRTDAWERLPGVFHGAGSTQSAALATYLAQGIAMFDAVYLAQRYTWDALAQGTRPGMGKSLPNRFPTKPA
ncbi:MAG: hydroxymethylpyrimidine/phosphomethylpyrimidine kinase [Uliginosibacterium sp.]|nr:hydroxymethylpyrimidine/phosphomethylpyrimidine kinase [Uliginosibacterium sp.]